MKLTTQIRSAKPIFLAIPLVLALFLPAFEQTCSAQVKESRHKSQIVPDFSRATLTHDGNQILPVSVREACKAEALVGDILLCVNGATIQGVSIQSGETVWTTESRHREPVSFLGASNTHALFSDMPIRGKAADAEVLNVYCLQLKPANWMSPLAIPLDDAERKTVLNVNDALLWGNDAFVLSTSSETGEGFHESMKSYRVTCFDTNTSKLKWTRKDVSAGQPKFPAAFLLGSLGPAFDNSSIVHLSRLRSHLLVCAGPFDEVMTVDPETGELRWTIPRIGEYRRGFIGPSVWKYYVGRYGQSDLDVQAAELTFDELKSRNAEGKSFVDEEYFLSLKDSVNRARERVEEEPSWIVAGPVVVQSSSRKDDAFRAFIAVARASHGDWANYLADCVIYEISESGSVLATVSLPTFVRGSQFHVVEDEVVWRCEHAIALLRTSSEFGAPSASIAVDYRTLLPKEPPEAWMQSGHWNDVTAFIGGSMLCIRQGGYQEKKDSKEIRFPLSKINLKTGAEQTLLLTIPFDGRIPRPTHNFSDSAQGLILYGSFPLVVSRLEFRGDQLVIGIKERGDEEGNESMLVFSIDAATF